MLKLESVESFAGSSSWNIFMDKFSGNIKLLDPYKDVNWMRTDPVQSTLNFPLQEIIINWIDKL